MKKYIKRMVLENAELRVKMEKARADCLKQKEECEKLAKQLDIETAIKKAKDGIPNS